MFLHSIPVFLSSSVPSRPPGLCKALSKAAGHVPLSAASVSGFSSRGVTGLSADSDGHCFSSVFLLPFAGHRGLKFCPVGVFGFWLGAGRGGKAELCAPQILQHF